MSRRLIAVGDIHGCFDQFKKLVEKIRITKSDRIVLLGDYIDRGSQSKEVIDYIIELKEDGFDVVPVIGNHEIMLMNACINEEHLWIWLMNGGDRTLSSFGIKKVTDIKSGYLDFFKSLIFYFETDEYLFVHAGFNDVIKNPFEDYYHMIWKCREKYTHPALKNRIVVHGHRVISPTACDEKIRNRDKVIGLDTGCVYSGMNWNGRLTALELYSGTIYCV